MAAVITPELVDQVTATIVERFQPERVVLFGSQATGEGGADSDLDIYVEMESSLRPPDRARLIRSAFPDRDWPLDIVVYTRGSRPAEKCLRDTHEHHRQQWSGAV